MNISEYISSGIVESYVLGLADEDEQEEFERLSNIYPQLADARDAFELGLEHHILAGAKQPPQYVLSSLLPKIKAGSSVLLTPAPMPAINGHAKNIARRTVFTPYLTAAAIIALVCCVYFLYRLHVQNDSLAKANQQLLVKFKQSDSSLNSLVNEQSLAGNKHVSVVHLSGNTAPTQPQANIYWDSASAEVYMVVKNLPVLPQEKQYQLWAQINGKPKSLGVFDAPSDKVIFKMNGTKKAEAFAITVEPKGGNTSPAGKVQVAGKAKGL